MLTRSRSSATPSLFCVALLWSKSRHSGAITARASLALCALCLLLLPWFVSAQSAPPSTPTGVTIAGAGTTVTISWPAVSGATSYKVLRSTTSGNFTGATTQTTTSLSYPWTGLTTGTPYYFVVRAVNSVGESANSTQVTTTPLATPAVTATWSNASSGSTGNVVLSWGAIPGANGYKVYRHLDGESFDYGSPLASTGSINYGNNAIANNTNYYYEVRAYNTASFSDSSATLTRKPLSPPTNLVATWSGTTANLTWDANADASSYKIFRSASSSDFTNATITTSNTNAAQITGLTPGTAAYFLVHSVNATGETANSAVRGVTALTAPSPFTLTWSSGKATLGWGAVTGASGYDVFGDNGSGTLNYTTPVGSTTTSLGYTKTSLNNGTAYKFVVRAKNTGGSSIDSTSMSVTPLAAPSVQVTAVGTTTASLSWNTVIGATGYKVFRHDTSGGFVTTDYTSTTAASLTVSGLTTGTTYSFMVHALNASGETLDSNVVTAIPQAPPAKPSLQAQVGDARVLLSWGTVSGATSYQLLRSTTFNDPNPAPLTTAVGSLVALDGNAVSYMDTTAQNGSTYYYTLIARNGGGSSLPSDQAIAALAADGTNAPIVVTGTPVSLTTFPNNTRTVVVRYRDIDGSSNLMCGWMMVNDRVDWMDSVCVMYDASANLLYLRSDDGSAWLGGYAPGSNNTITNAQGSLNCAGTSVTRTDTDLVISYSVTAMSGLEGNNNIYGYTNDPDGNESGWVQIGTWNVTPQNGPQLVMPSPALSLSTSADQDQVVSMTYHHGDGAAALSSEWVMIGKVNAWTNSIAAVYNRPQNVLYLRNDDGSAWLGGYAPGSAHSISNSQGTIDCASTSVTVQDNDLTVNWHITPRTGSLGTNTIWAYCDDQAGQQTAFPFVSIGTWTVNLPAPLSVSAHATDSSHIALSWDSVTSATGYQVFRSTQSGTYDYVHPTATVNAPQVTLNDSNLTPDTTYYYVVRATSTGGNSASSSPASAHTVALPLLSFDSSSVSVTEGDAGTTTTLTFQPKVSAPLTEPLSFSYATQAVSAEEGVDYVGTAGTVTLAAGGTLAPITVTINGDTSVEGDETFNLVLSSISGASVASGTTVEATGTILNDDIAAPMAPTGLRAVPGNASVALSWDTVPGATSYQVWRSTSSHDYAGVTPQTVPAPTTTLDDTGLDNGKPYFYIVKAVGAGGVGAESTEATATPLAAPAAPTLRGQGGDKSASLSWDRVPDALHYALVRSTVPNDDNPMPVTTVDDPQSQTSDSPLSNGTTYYYRLKASGIGGEGDYSNEVLVTPNPSIDATIQDNDGSWKGTGLIEASADDKQSVSQDVESGETANYQVKVKRNSNGGNSNQNVTLFATGASGETSFFADKGDGQPLVDMRPDITSTNGWSISLAPGQVVTVNVQVPVSDEMGANDLTITAKDEDGSQTPVSDQVKATAVTVPSFQPDVTLERLDSNGQSADSVGENVFNNDAQQTISSVSMLGQTHSYRAHIKNTSVNKATFQVSFDGPGYRTGTDVDPTKWSGQATVGSDTTDIFSQLQEGRTIDIDGGAEVVLNLSLTSPATATPGLVSDGSFRLKAWKGHKSDAVVGNIGVQSIEKLQWSRDGQTWNDTPLTAEQYQVIAFRAVPTNTTVSYDDLPDFKPEWTEQGATHWGEIVWIHFPTLGTISIAAECGNSKTVNVQVVESPQ